MKCPTCSEKLLQTKDYFYCSKHDGVLLMARHLMRKKEIEIPENTLKSRESTLHIIKCPNCNQLMHKTDYDSTGIIIDSCMNCHYRWLDYGELTKIKTFDPDLDAEDLLFLQSVDTQIEKKTKEQMDSRIPGYATGYVGGVGRSLSASRSERTLGWMSGGLIFGIVRTLVKGSWAQRFVLLLAIITFSLLGWFIWGQIKATFR